MSDGLNLGITTDPDDEDGPIRPAPPPPPPPKAKTRPPLETQEQKVIALLMAQVTSLAVIERRLGWILIVLVIPLLLSLSAGFLLLILRVFAAFG